MGEKEETLGGKISFFQILPRLMKFRLLRKKNGVSFTVVHCDRPRQDTSSDVSLFSAFTTGDESDQISTRDLKTKSNAYIFPSPHLDISFNAISAIMKDACSIVSSNSTCDLKTALPRVTEFTKTAIKDINLKRYRVIVTSYAISGRTFQGTYASRFLWDEQMDRCIEYKHKMENGFLICVAYLIHME